MTAAWSSRTIESWPARFAATRLASAVIAAVLLAAHRVTDHDGTLALVGLTYGVISAAAILAIPRVVDRWPAWALDGAACLGLVLASEAWRSPFYLMALSATLLPAARLPLRRALQWGCAYACAYAAIAVATGLDIGALRTTARLDTFATHVLLPLAVTFGVAYASENMRRLRAEQHRSERLAVENERKRIAWELHDSAKQRLHAASLMLSSLQPEQPAPAPVLHEALEQLRGATADMDSSIGELRSPLEGRPLDLALRDRVAELAAISDAVIEITGTAPAMEPVNATHVYRILSEAISNAVRHAGASRIGVRLQAEDRTLRAVVEDDGCGIPEHPRPGSSGLLTMRSRAFAIGAQISISSTPAGVGTTVELRAPISKQGGNR